MYAGKKVQRTGRLRNRKSEFYQRSRTEDFRGMYKSPSSSRPCDNYFSISLPCCSTDFYKVDPGRKFLQVNCS